MKYSNVLIVLAFLICSISTNAQDYYFYGYQDSIWSNTQNWDNFNGYPGTTIPANQYARIPSNFSLGRCSLDVDIVNNGRLLLQSKFYYNGHTVTNNGTIEFTGTIWGDLTNESGGILSLGWEPFFPTDNLSVNGSFSNDGLVLLDFRGTNNSWDFYQSITTANFGGDIEFRFRDNFTPVIGQEYIIFYTNNNGVNGTFVNETYPAGYTGSLIYETNRVKVVFSVAPLPVELSNFEVKQEYESAILNWITGSEQNNLGFAIEKSYDDNDWKRIGFVEGNGTTNNVSQYDFVDKNLSSGINYYRLKQTDYDGQTEYSEVRTLEFKGLDPKVTVFPNPSQRNVNIQIDNPTKRRMKITVNDYLGRMIWESGLIENEIFWKKEFEIEKNGTYFITVEIGNEIYFDRVIVMDEK